MSRSISPPWISNYVQQRLKSLKNPADENQRYHQTKKKEPKVVQVLCVYPEQSSLLISDTVSCIEIFMSILCKEKLSSSFRETGNLKDLKLCQIKIEDYHLSTFVQCASHFDIEAHMRLNKRSPPLTLHCSKITYLGAQDCEKMGSPQEINSSSIVRDLISGVSYRYLYDGLAGLQFPAQKQLPDLENKFPAPREINDENPVSVISIFVVPETTLRTRVLATISFEQAEMIRLQRIPNNDGVSETLPAAAEQAVIEEQWSQSQTFNWVETWTETQVDEFAGTQIDTEVHENTSVAGACQVVISVEDSPDGKPVVEQSVEISGTLVDETLREYESVNPIGAPLQHRLKSRETQNSGPPATLPGNQPALSTQSAGYVTAETLVETLTETLVDVTVKRNPSDLTTAVLESTVVPSSSSVQQPIHDGSSSDENASSNQKKRKRADQEYIGCRVQKEFEGELYRGTVISCRKFKLKRTAMKSTLLWLIKYEDDDKEEMTTYELKRILQMMQIETSAAATPSAIGKSPAVPAMMLEDLYVNRRVRKMFSDKKMYEGTVTSSRILKNGQRWWFITYDDGDEEEMSTRMLKRCATTDDSSQSYIAETGVPIFRFLQEESGAPSKLSTIAKPATTVEVSAATAVVVAVNAQNDGSHGQTTEGTLPDHNVMMLETVVAQHPSSQNEEESSAALHAAETLVDDGPVQIIEQTLPDSLVPSSNCGEASLVEQTLPDSVGPQSNCGEGSSLVEQIVPDQSNCGEASLVDQTLPDRQNNYDEGNLVEQTVLDRIGQQSNRGEGSSLVEQIVPEKANPLHSEGNRAGEQVDRRRHRNGHNSIPESSIAKSKSRKVGLLPSGKTYLMGEMKIRKEMKLPPPKFPPRTLDEMIRLLYK